MSAIVSVIAVLAALVLAWQGLRSDRLDASRTIRLAAIWAVVIVGLVVLLRLAGA